MLYVSRVNEDRVRVVMYGRILYMTNEEYAKWKVVMSWGESDNN